MMNPTMAMKATKLGIWIDYNGDGDFTDPDELVYSAD